MKSKGNGYKLLSIAIIRSGFKENDEAFINGEWIGDLYLFSETERQDYKEIEQNGILSKQAYHLKGKIRYYKQIGKNCDKLIKEYREILEKKKYLKKSIDKRKRLI